MTTDLLAVIGPVTTAARFEKKINAQSRISTRIIHTPDTLSSGGCSYSIKTKAENFPILLEIANQYKIKVKGYYLCDIIDGKEVYHVIS